MFKNYKHPVMPRLRFIREIKEEEISPSYRHQSYNLYSLDWTRKNQIMREDFADWVRRCWSEKIVDGKMPEFVPAFPPEFESEVKGYEFMLSPSCLGEIRHESQLGVLEWNRNRGFDTMIREECLGGAIAHFSSAFTLLADCIVVKRPKDGLLGWSHDLWVLRAILLYKFWERECGRGCALRHAHIDRWDDGDWRTRYDGEQRDHLERFLSAVTRQFNLHDKSITDITMPITERQAFYKKTEPSDGAIPSNVVTGIHDPEKPMINNPTTTAAPRIG